MTWISLIVFPICANDSNFLNSLTIAVLTSFSTYSTMHKEDYFVFVFKEGNWTSAKKYALKAENETHLVASVSLHISSSCRKLHHALWICHLSITLSNLKGSSLVSSAILIGCSLTQSLHEWPKPLPKHLLATRSLIISVVLNQLFLYNWLPGLPSPYPLQGAL